MSVMIWGSSSPSGISNSISSRLMIYVIICGAYKIGLGYAYFVKIENFFVKNVIDKSKS